MNPSVHPDDVIHATDQLVWVDFRDRDKLKKRKKESKSPALRFIKMRRVSPSKNFMWVKKLTPIKETTYYLTVQCQNSEVLSKINGIWETLKIRNSRKTLRRNIFLFFYRLSSVIQWVAKQSCTNLQQRLIFNIPFEWDGKWVDCEKDCTR